MSDNPGHAVRLQNCLRNIPTDAKRIILAFSGGLDSCVLLHLLANNKTASELELWHVNHGLQEAANEMALFCQEAANKYSLNLVVSQLNLSSVESNIEAIARTARYSLFEKNLRANDCLLTAHHADDQAETLMLNILRGSGSRGLSGIAYTRTLGKAKLLRPLLDIPRNTLIDFAQQNRLEWFDDPSNDSNRFNRNFLRHKIMPVFRQRWPGYLSSFSKVSNIQRETQELIDDLAKLDFDQIALFDRVTGLSTLNQLQLLKLTRPRQKNVIRFWVRYHDYPGLPQAKLNDLIAQLNARHDAMPVVSLNNYEIRIYNQNLFIVSSPADHPSMNCYEFGLQPELQVTEINLKIKRTELFKRFSIIETGQLVTLKFRLRMGDSNSHKHRLKRLFQQHKIPPWKRPDIPQVYINDDLIGLIV